MADFSRDPREHWLKPRFSKNEVANSGRTKDYGGPDAAGGRPVYLVGVNYNPETRTIDEPLVEPL